MMQYLPVFIAVLFSASSSDAFVHHAHKSSIQRRMMGVRPALIFSSDREGSGAAESFESSLFSNKFSTSSSLCNQFAESISQDFVAPLARMAVAFSPPERALQLKNLEKVQILGMDETHLDIEAVLCENEECISLSVPVAFPSPCASGSSLESLSECIYDNINTLDFEASKVVEKLHQDKEKFEAYQRLFAVRHYHDLELPRWWINPIGELVAECDFLIKLLNEDEFSKEVRGLASRAMYDVLGEDFEVQQAAVELLGPAGLVIRASYAEESLFGRSPASFESTELPISFKTAARDASELRELVLRTVEQ